MFIELVSFCECCGEIPKQLGINDSNTYWCLCCANANGDISEDAFQLIEKALSALALKRKK